MANNSSNKPVQTWNSIFPRAYCLLGKVAVLIALALLSVGSTRGFASEPSFTEYQVKAGFLFNFIKYVVWPPDAFTDAASSITIGVVGEDKFGDDLRKAVEGKSFDGRIIVVRQFHKEDDFSECHILFVGASERKALNEILSKIKARPILTVGETDDFLKSGGIIRFAKKEGKVRLEVDLDSAREARLQISSKLLAVADVVHGKR